MAQRFVPHGEEVKIKTENSRMRVCAIAREERGTKAGATESAHAPGESGEVATESSPFSSTCPPVLLVYCACLWPAPLRPRARGGRPR